MIKSKKRAGRVLALLLSIMMIVGMLSTGALTVQAEDHSDQDRVIVENTTYTNENAPWLGQTGVNFEDIYKATGEYLVSLGTPGVGSAGGEWRVIGLARSGREVSDGYYDAVLQFVKEEINDKEQLHKTKSTENSRIILALTALGMDVTDVGGHNLLQGLTDMDYVTKQGINGPIWALIAFDSADYEIPAAPEGSDQVTREKLMKYILDRQLENGGWTLFGSKADPDITGMAIQSLASYYNDEHPEVKAALDAAVKCLSSIQGVDGGFGSWGTVNAESCAQIIVALTSLGIDPTTDARFVKADGNLVSALLAFAVDGGGFKHIASGNVNGMATEQGYSALVAYDRFVVGKTSLYDMSDINSGTENPSVPEDKAVTLTDINGTGITLNGKESILNGIELETNILTAGNLYDKVREALWDGKFIMYDLYLLKNNQEVQSGGTVTISIPIPEGYDGAKCKVYRMNGDGSVTEITVALTDSKLVFETSQMGALAVWQPVEVNTNEPGNNDGTTDSGSNSGTTKSPQTGDNSNDVLWLMVSLLSLSALTVLGRKKSTVE